MNVIITGASSGLGKCIAEQFRDKGITPVNWSHDTGVDLTSRYSLLQARKNIYDASIDVLINCAGINLISYWPDTDELEWDEVMENNVKSIFLTTQMLLPNLRGGTVLNIVSNAARVPMTCSAAYNASKGAALILTKQMARELGKTHGITVFSVSPNKLKGTPMSEYIDKRVQELRGWTAEQAREYQLAGLPAGEETPPEVLAEFIMFLLSTKERHKYLAGCDITYGGP